MILLSIIKRTSFECGFVCHNSNGDRLQGRFLQIFSIQFRTIIYTKMNSLLPIDKRYSFQVFNFKQAFPNIYKVYFFSLKAQLTVLDTLLSKISNPITTANSDDKVNLQYINFLIESLKETKYSDLFQSADGIISSIRNMVNNHTIHQEIEKILNTLLNAALSISNICTCLSVTFSTQREDMSFQGIIPPSNYSNEPLVVCRICDSQIPVSEIEEHTRLCVASYKNEGKLKQINKRIKKIIGKIKKQFLDTEWPNEKEKSIELIFPMLHLKLLLERALNLDPQISDTIDELNFIQGCISSFLNNDFSNNLIKKSLYLVSEKHKTSNALNDANYILRQTLLTGSKEKNTPILVSDFNFIKRISRGAYATVFLAQKKTTGDIFAVKVTPRTSLKQKNQVRRLLIEKDILLKFSNPFIVTFCM